MPWHDAGPAAQRSLAPADYAVSDRGVRPDMLSVGSGQVGLQHYVHLVDAALAAERCEHSAAMPAATRCWIAVEQPAYALVAGGGKLMHLRFMRDRHHSSAGGMPKDRIRETIPCLFCMSRY